MFAPATLALFTSASLLLAVAPGATVCIGIRASVWKMSAPGAYFTTAVKAEPGAGASVVIQYLSVKPIQPF